MRDFTDQTDQIKRQRFRWTGQFDLLQAMVQGFDQTLAVDRFPEGHFPFPGAVLLDQHPQSYLPDIPMTQLRAIEGMQDELTQRDQQHLPTGDG